MIKTTLSRFAMLLSVLFIASCETDIDLTSDEGDSAVVFALLDPDTAIQYIKINKTFVGDQDASVLARDPSSFNYPEGTLDIVLEGYENGQLKQTITQVTRTTDNPKESTGSNGSPGIFTTSGNVLYEVETSGANKINHEYKYLLKINNKSTGEQITAETEVINNFPQSDITFPRVTSLIKGKIPFASKVNNYTDYTFEWTTHQDAREYELTLLMNYRETDLNGSTDTSEMKSFEVLIGRATSKTFQGREKLLIDYNGESFYARVNEEFSKKEKKKWLVESLSLRFLVGGEELNTYILVNQPSEGIVQEKPEYTNFTNAIGIFSTRREFNFPNYILAPEGTVDELILGKYTKGAGLSFCVRVNNSVSYQCE